MITWEEFLYSKHGLFIIEQNRSQNRLAIKLAGMTSWSSLYEESSNYWINLTNDLHVREEDNIIYSTEGQVRANQYSSKIMEINFKRQNPKPFEQPSSLKGQCSVWNELYESTENHLFMIDLEGGD